MYLVVSLAGASAAGGWHVDPVALPSADCVQAALYLVQCHSPLTANPVSHPKQEVFRRAPGGLLGEHRRQRGQLTLPQRLLQFVAQILEGVTPRPRCLALYAVCALPNRSPVSHT